LSEEIVSHRSTNIADIETSGWETCQRSLIVEMTEESVSYRGNMASVETSAWDARERSTGVESVEKVVSYAGRTISK